MIMKLFSREQSCKTEGLSPDNSEALWIQPCQMLDLSLAKRSCGPHTALPSSAHTHLLVIQSNSDLVVAALKGFCR